MLLWTRWASGQPSRCRGSSPGRPQSECFTWGATAHRRACGTPSTNAATGCAGNPSCMKPFSFGHGIAVRHPHRSGCRGAGDEGGAQRRRRRRLRQPAQAGLGHGTAVEGLGHDPEAAAAPPKIGTPASKSGALSPFSAVEPRRGRRKARWLPGSGEHLLGAREWGLPE